MGAECSKLRQPMPAIFALCRAQLLLLVVTRSQDQSGECHVTKHKMPARSNFTLSNFENSGTIQFSSLSSTSRRLCPKNFEKRAHTTPRPALFHKAIIEDERHVLEECPLYEDVRKELEGGLLEKLREGDYGPLFVDKNTMLFGKLVKKIMKKRFP